jgi:hypothetical protein
VELRLTATLQLRLCRNLLCGGHGDFGPRSRPSTAPPGPGGAAIDSPSGRRSRSRCSRPRTEHATWPLTPSVATRRARRRPLGRLRCHVPPGPLPPPPRQRRQPDRTRVPSIDECSLRPVHALLAQHDPGHRREPDAVSPRWRSPPRAPEGERAELQRLDPVPGGVGHAPLIDFCNQHNPRARLRDHPNPGPRLGGCPLLRGYASRRGRNPTESRVRLRARLGPGCACAPAWVTRPGGAELLLETSLAARSRFRTAPAEVSRARGRTAFATRHLSPRFLATRASPQPDRLGHLVS